MLRQIAAGAAAVLTAGVLAVGCSDDGGDTIVLGGGSDVLPTNADLISSRLEDSWATGERSINESNVEELYEGRVFRSRSGEGLLFYTTSDDGTEKMFAAYLPASGGAADPVRIVVPGAADEAFSDAVDSMVGAFVGTDRAVFAFIAQQDNDASSATDLESDRVWYMTWTRAAGFSTPTAVDTNSSPAATDDNSVSTLFMVTNLYDGTQTYELNENDLGDFVSGPAGDAAANLTPGVYFGWQNLDTNNDARLEGAFVDLTTLDLEPVQAISIPVASTGESVLSTMQASGRDLLFMINDTTSTPAENHLYLVRADFDTLDMGAAIDLDRGDSTDATAYVINTPVLIGDGYRPLNGARATWVLFTDSFHSDATVTNDDGDLLVFQVSDTGTVTFEEADHEAPASANGNSVTDFQVQFERGAPGVWIYYTQQVDFTNSVSAGLFARALRLDDTQALADNLSDEVKVNTSDTTNGNDDTDVTDVYFAETDPFCSPDTNAAATYVVYLQGVDEDTGGDGSRMAGVLLEVDDPTANPITVSVVNEDEIVDNADIDWNDSLDGTWPVVVLPSSDPNGAGIVFYAANGNNLIDRGAGNAFVELRAFLYAPAILNTTAGVTHELPPTQFDTDAVPNAVAFPQHEQLTTTVEDLHAVAVPNRAAERDFDLDDDEVTPTRAYLVWPEYAGVDSSENGEVWVARSLDLTARGLTDVEDRFTPPLTERPHDVSRPNEELDDLDSEEMTLLPEGERVLAIFNTEPGTDDNTHGRFFATELSATGVSAPALLTNDSAESLPTSSYGFTADDVEFLVVPGPSCGNAVGAWFFYVRLDANAFDSAMDNLRMQARHFTGVDLP